jgi:hypothetical protein
VKIDREHLRAYANRPWGAIEQAKREDIAARARQSPEAHARAIAALREHMRRVRPDWPTPDDLARDLADHIELKRKIDHAAALWCARHDRRR